MNLSYQYLHIPYGYMVSNFIQCISMDVFFNIMTSDVNIMLCAFKTKEKLSMHYNKLEILIKLPYLFELFL